MLKTRLITGIFYIVFVFALIFILPMAAFNVAMGLISCLMLLEWMRLAGVQETWQRLLWLNIFVVLLCVAAWWQPGQNLMVTLAMPFWFSAIIFLIARQRFDTQLKMLGGVEVLLGLAVLLPMFAGLVQLRELPQGQLWVLMLFVLLWSSDSFAYAAGRLFGKHKLASKISPGKTWEGFIGGLLLTVIALWVYKLVVFKELMLEPTWFGLVALLVVLATAGDLFESYIKRSHNVKDSGNILPGHGGLLDRLDSMTAAAPIFAIFSVGGLL
jgi:phosphatidate cytidylyltransferase